MPEKRSTMSITVSNKSVFRPVQLNGRWFVEFKEERILVAVNARLTKRRARILSAKMQKVSMREKVAGTLHNSLRYIEGIGNTCQFYTYYPQGSLGGLY